jgi:hypothetical protein
LTHILDRGHDDDELFDLIDTELEDKFIIRFKGNRNSAVQTFEENKQKEQFVKWGQAHLANRVEKTYEKACFTTLTQIFHFILIKFEIPITNICLHQSIFTP